MLLSDGLMESYHSVDPDTSAGAAARPGMWKRLDTLKLKLKKETSEAYSLGSFFF